MEEWKFCMTLTTCCVCFYKKKSFCWPFDSSIEYVDPVKRTAKFGAAHISRKMQKYN